MMIDPRNAVDELRYPKDSSATANAMIAPMKAGMAVSGMARSRQK